MKKIIPLILIIALIVLMVPSEIFAEEIESPYILEAEKLFELGLMLGTGNGFELLRVPQRVEAAIMLVRLLGSESEALMGEYQHPFTDVPDWADSYVGFLYEAGLTKGIGGGLYDSYSDVDAKTYLTFLLRTIGFSDDAGDFTWENAIDGALNIGLINFREYETLNNQEFTRGHMAALSYNALNIPMNNSDRTLAGELVLTGAIEENTAQNININLVITPEKKYLHYLNDGEYMPYVVGVDLNTAEIMLRKAGINEYELTYTIDELIPEGSVISQSCPAYLEAEEGNGCILTISRGPSPIYHRELTDLCINKGWEEEVTPYIIGAAKYLIKNTVLSKYDILKKLDENLNDIAILSYEDSAAMSFAALYDASTKNMYINRYVLSYELVLHELSHTLSNNILTGKVGFLKIGDNTRVITEAFAESIESKASGDDSGALNTFRAGDEKIVFTSDAYFCNSDNNYVLGVFSPLFLLAGENTVEKMYFKDTVDYSAEVLKFNERYGERKWETLWNLAEIFAHQPGFLSEDDRIAKASVYRNYLDGILECLQVDLIKAGSDDSKLRLLLFKTRDIKKSYPLGYADYRERIEDFEREIILSLSNNTLVSKVAESSNWIIPDYSGKSPEYVYNSLIIEGDASAVGYMVVAADTDIETDTDVFGVLYKEPGMSNEEAVELQSSDEKPLKGEYIILIPEEKINEGDYTLMRDLVNDFDKYLADYSHLVDYAVGRLLRSEGFGYRYEFTYYDNVVPAMEGRIVEQFPAPGSAIIPGKTIIRLFMLKKTFWKN